MIIQTLLNVIFKCIYLFKKDRQRNQNQGQQQQQKVY